MWHHSLWDDVLLKRGKFIPFPFPPAGIEDFMLKKNDVFRVIRFRNGKYHQNGCAMTANLSRQSIRVIFCRKLKEKIML